MDYDIQKNNCFFCSKQKYAHILRWTLLLIDYISHNEFLEDLCVPGTLYLIVYCIQINLQLLWDNIKISKNFQETD